MGAKLDHILENKGLKREFAALGLDIGDVFQETPEELKMENSRLRVLLHWARTYRACPNREALEAKGMLFPPVEPDYDPDTDWLRFERWMEGKPVKHSLNVVFKDLDAMSDTDVAAELEEVVERLHMHGYIADLHIGVPDRLVYAYLREEVEGKEFDIMAPGGMVMLDGCNGFCPDCFQRPWCEQGAELVYVEDEDCGKMALPTCLAPYVSASNVSLEILRENERYGPCHDLFDDDDQD